MEVVRGHNIEVNTEANESRSEEIDDSETKFNEAEEIQNKEREQDQEQVQEQVQEQEQEQNSLNGSEIISDVDSTSSEASEHEEDLELNHNYVETKAVNAALDFFLKAAIQKQQLVAIPSTYGLSHSYNQLHMPNNYLIVARSNLQQLPHAQSQHPLQQNNQSVNSQHVQYANDVTSSSSQSASKKSKTEYKNNSSSSKLSQKSQKEEKSWKKPANPRRQRYTYEELSVHFGKRFHETAIALGLHGKHTFLLLFLLLYFYFYYFYYY